MVLLWETQAKEQNWEMHAVDEGQNMDASLEATYNPHVKSCPNLGPKPCPPCQGTSGNPASPVSNNTVLTKPWVGNFTSSTFREASKIPTEEGVARRHGGQYPYRNSNLSAGPWLRCPPGPPGASSPSHPTNMLAVNQSHILGSGPERKMRTVVQLSVVMVAWSSLPPKATCSMGVWLRYERLAPLSVQPLLIRHLGLGPSSALLQSRCTNRLL